MKNWVVKPGDEVSKGDPLCYVMLGTIKRTVSSKFYGKVIETKFAEGDKIPGGEIICVIDGTEEKSNELKPVEPGTVVQVTADNLMGPSGLVKEWYKQPGEKVEPKEPILAVAVGKLTAEVSCPYGGTVKEIMPDIDAKVNKGDVVASVVADGSMAGPELPKPKVVVIGGGPGGYVAAIRAGQLGAEVTVIEKERMGGTCLNRGCIPTKALLHSAEVYQTAVNAAKAGVKIPSVELDWDGVQKNRRSVSSTLIVGVEGLVEANGGSIIKGTATFTGPKSLTVKTAYGIKTYEPDKIIIATGSSPAMPPIPGLAGNDACIDSTGALQMKKLPKSMIIVGGGVIGIELACAYAAFGCKVTIVEMMDRLMPVMDLELTLKAQKIMEEHGIEFFLETQVLSFEKTANGSKVLTKLKSGEEKVFEAEKVLVAVGRKSNIAGLDLEKAGIETERGHIVVNDKMETNVKDVYAIGDCVGKIMLAHTASTMGEIAAENAMGMDEHYDESVCPSCVYMLPEFAYVGINEEQAKAQGLKYKVGRFPMQANGKSLIMEEKDGWIKIIADKETNKILGVHILGARATDVIAESAMAMKMGATVDDMINTIHAHPTVAEAMKEAAMAVEKRAIHFK